jgi:hypothetical protein
MVGKFRLVRELMVPAVADGAAFYDIENLTIQLLQDGSTWPFKIYRNTSSFFSGETVDLKVSIGLIRNNSNTTGLQALTGIVHERSQNMSYEIRPDSRCLGTVRIRHEDDLPPMRVAEPSSFIECVINFDSSTSITSAWSNNINNALGLHRMHPAVIDVMIIRSESSECFESGLVVVVTALLEPTSKFQAFYPCIQELNADYLVNPNLFKTTSRRNDQIPLRER